MCSGNVCVLWQVAPRMFLTILFVEGCKSSLASQSCQWENNEQRLRPNYLFQEGNQFVNSHNHCCRKTDNCLIFIVSSINNNCVLVLSFLLFMPFFGRKQLFASQVKVQRAKISLTKNNIKGWNDDCGGKQTPFHPFHPSKDASFPFFDGKWTDLIRQKWISKCLFQRRHIL